MMGNYKIDTIEEQGRDNKTSRRSYNEMPNEKGQTDKQWSTKHYTEI